MASLKLNTASGGSVTITPTDTAQNYTVSLPVTANGSLLTTTELDAQVAAKIGVTIQGYDANTAKYNATTSNFTGTLQNNGNNVLTVANIGTSVQAYDVDLTNWSNKTAPTGTVVGTTDIQTLTNKTLQSPNITSGLTLNGTAGTSGQVLTSAGSGIPTWSTPATGAMTLISTQTVSSSTTSVTWSNLSGYSRYILKVSNAIPTATGVLGIQLGTGAGPTFTTSGYYNISWFVNDTTRSYYNNQGGESYIRIGLSSNVSNSGKGVVSELIINGCDTTTSQYIMNSGFIYSGSSFQSEWTNGQVNTPSAVTAIKVFFVSGNNIASGKFSLYGISS